MNIGAPWPSLNEAEARVLGLQKKLNQWALADGQRRFDDVFNLVCDPAFLVVAWQRVRGNKGARTAGVDGIAPRSIGEDADAFLMGLRAQLKALQFRALPVRQRQVPAAGNPRDGGSGGAGLTEAGDGAYFRGRFQAMFLWLSPESTCTGCNCGDSLSQQALSEI
jgi:hypothetical protein